MNLAVFSKLKPLLMVAAGTVLAGWGYLQWERINMSKHLHLDSATLTDDAILRLFDHLDADHSGAISEQDLMAALNISGGVNLRSMMAAADNDKDGVISRDDFLQLVRRVQHTHQQAARMTNRIAPAILPPPYLPLPLPSPTPAPSPSAAETAVSQHRSAWPPASLSRLPLKQHHVHDLAAAAIPGSATAITAAAAAAAPAAAAASATAAAPTAPASEPDAKEISRIKRWLAKALKERAEREGRARGGPAGYSGEW